MAKFRSGDLLLKDGQYVKFGDSQDANLWWDGSDMRLDSTISGVDPSQSYHLTTKYYVDSEITSNVITDHGNLAGLGDDDHTQYIRVDGTRGFTSTVSGIDPTQSYHLTTKDYVDSAISTATGTLTTDHGALVGLADDDHTQYILVDGTRDFTGVFGSVGMILTEGDVQFQSAPGSDADVSGNTSSGTVTGASAFGQALYMQSDGTWALAKADAESTMPVAAITTTAATGNQKVLTYGYARNDSWDWTVGGLVYASDATAGALTQTAPTASGSQVQVVGVATHADRIFFNPSYVLAELGDPPYYTKEELTTSGVLDVRYYTESEIDSMLGGSVDHGNLVGLGDDDHTQYIRVDGTRAFTGTVSGIDPTESAHLTTKNYVDSNFYTQSQLTSSGVLDVRYYTESEIDSMLGGSVDHGNLLGLGDDDHTQYILVDGSRGFTGTVSGIDPTQSYHLTTKNYIDSNFYTQTQIQDNYLPLTGGTITGNLFIDQDLVVRQDLVVSGTRFITKTETVEITDNLLLINEGEVGPGVTASGGVAGIEVDRGPGTTNYQFFFDETSDNFKVGEVGDLQPVATRLDNAEMTASGIAIWDAGEIRLETTGGFTYSDGNVTVEAAAPTADDHLTRKDYVDDAIATATGTLTTDHGSLVGLADDDHTQYILVDGTRAFTGVFEAVGMDLTEGSVKFQSTLASDHSVSGNTSSGTVSNVTAFGQALYMKSDGTWDLADATDDTTMPAAGLTTAAANGVQTILTYGYARDDSWDWTPGGEIYIDTTAGALTQTAPDTNGNQVQIVGVATHADRIFFNPSYSAVEIGDALYYTKDELTTSGVLDVRYYTESEIDSMLSSSVDHGNLLGLGDDDHTQYILVDGTRGFTSTVSGVDPTQDFHLTTKDYVDTAITTATGSLTTDHGALTGLEDDDHTQYILADGTRAFTGVYDAVGMRLTDGDVQFQSQPSTDGDVSGNTASGTVTGVSAIGQALYMQSDGTWTLAKADAESTMPVAAITTTAATGDQKVLTYGFIRNDSWDWTVGGIIYASDATAGGLTQTVPTASGSYAQSVGVATHADRIFFNPNYVLVEAGEPLYFTKEELEAGALDGRYFTETELTTSGVLDSRYYTESEVDALISGSVDHGNLLGLADDDHTQYIRVDGTRGFTATVSGVTPTQDYHLATKSYVDNLSTDLHGRESIGNGVDHIDVSFADQGTTNYTINATLENTSDSPPSIYAFIVTAKSSTGFTVTFMGDTDSANYVLNWSIILDA